MERIIKSNSTSAEVLLRSVYIMDKKENMPSWVYWGLWGINSRKVALAFSIGSLFLSFAVIAFGVMINDYFLFTVVLVPLWYWFSIKWVDNNDSWSK